VDVVNVQEAKTHLWRLLERVEHGEENVLARAGTPVARLVPLRRSDRVPDACAAGSVSGTTSTRRCLTTSPRRSASLSCCSITVTRSIGRSSPRRSRTGSPW
jgi:prevent-host-death family protein